MVVIVVVLVIFYYFQIPKKSLLEGQLRIQQPRQPGVWWRLAVAGGVGKKDHTANQGADTQDAHSGSAHGTKPLMRTSF